MNSLPEIQTKPGEGIPVSTPAAGYTRRRKTGGSQSVLSSSSMETDKTKFLPLPPSMWFTVLLFLLLRECLAPVFALAEMTASRMTLPFYIALGSFLVLDGIRIPHLIRWLGKGTVSLLAAGSLFYPDAFPGLSWLPAYFHTTGLDWGNLVHGNYGSISGVNRTLLFLAGWAMLASVLHSLTLYGRTALAITGAVLVYLLLLAAGATADATGGAVRALAAGLLLAALQHRALLERAYSPPQLQPRSGRAAGRRRAPAGWLCGAVAITAAVLAAGMLGAGGAPRQAAPLDWQRWGEALADRWGMGPVNGQRSASARSGYGEDDSSLGGPLVPDDGIVFQAYTDQPTYWRGESKSIYTGKGWTRPHTAASPWREGAVDPALAEKGSIISQTVTFTEGIEAGRLFAGGRISSIVALVSQNGVGLPVATVKVDQQAQAYPLAAGAKPVQGYRIRTVLPASGEETLKRAGTDYPDEVIAEYLQLPDGLPLRIGELANTAASGKEDAYSRAIAVQQYLKINYTYSLDRARAPGNQVDFVDEFLFVTKVGYCDYFSTSMAVMLRTLGIPARWVKGYAPGDIRPANGSGAQEGYRTTVRNRDAHSWVEVYFPGSGWVPFDPTPGYDGSRSANSSAVATAANRSLSGGGGIPKSSASSDALSFAWVDRAWQRTAGFLSSAGVQTAASLAGIRRSLLAGISAAAGLLLVLIAAAYVQRRRIAFRLLLRRFGSGRKGRDTVLKLLDCLWVRVSRKHGPVESHLTMREYVNRLNITGEDKRRQLDELVRINEEIRYGGASGIFPSGERIRDLWIRLGRK